MSLTDAARLQVDDHLATLASTGSTHHQIDTSSQQNRVVQRPLRCSLGDGIAAHVEWREALSELADSFDGLATQVGFVAG